MQRSRASQGRARSAGIMLSPNKAGCIDLDDSVMGTALLGKWSNSMDCRVSTRESKAKLRRLVISPHWYRDRLIELLRRNEYVWNLN
jgi:hypothetical protein